MHLVILTRVDMNVVSQQHRGHYHKCRRNCGINAFYNTISSQLYHEVCCLCGFFFLGVLTELTGWTLRPAPPAQLLQTLPRTLHSEQQAQMRSSTLYEVCQCLPTFTDQILSSDEELSFTTRTLRRDGFIIKPKLKFYSSYSLAWVPMKKALFRGSVLS